MASPLLDLTPTAMVAGGDAIARDADGRVVLVSGALPGERVGVRLREVRRDFARGDVVDIIAPSPARIVPPCPFVAAGCGGCQWQHVAPSAQPGLKAEIVVDSLRRLGGIGGVPAIDVRAIAAAGYRTTLRMGVVAGRAAYHRSRSAELVAIDACLVAHPLVDELVRDGRFDGADEIVLRVGVASRERVVTARPDASRVRVPADVVVVGRGAARVGAVHEEVGGRWWRVSDRSFFQAGPAAAEAIAQAVDEAIGAAGRGGTIVDLYAGIGVLGGVAARRGDSPLVAVEQSRSAAADARVNLAHLDARVVACEVGKWRPEPAAVVIADPARTGLGRPGTAALAATGAPIAVLVGCDPASFGRDTRLLAASGYVLDSLTVIDAFPGTAHVEVVGRFGLRANRTN